MIRSKTALLIAVSIAALCAPVAGGFAADLPTGGQIVAGSAQIMGNVHNLVIDQRSPTLITNWQSFSIGTAEIVQFIQPSSSSVALNRVLGSDVSTIQGSLKANGQVFLVNPNGVLFSPTAQIDVGGLVASTLDIRNEDFLNGNHRFSGNSANAVVNRGNIVTGPGGVALVAAQIRNDGTITSKGGAIALGAGNDVTVDLGGPVSLVVNGATVETLIHNGGAIRTASNTILLTAKAADALTASAINNVGVIEAQTLATGEKGRILLIGDMASGTLTAGGTLDAGAAKDGQSGFVETSAAHVTTAEGLVVRARDWLIDPYDYVINATAATNISAALNANTNVTVTTASSNSSYGALGTTNGDITVSSAITKNTGGTATLTLRADRNIIVNSSISASSGKLGITLSAGNAAGATVGGVNVNANLTSNGGNILIGGGTGSSANGIGFALNLDSSNAAVLIQQNRTISSGGGDITINGKSLVGSSSGNYSGVRGGVYVASGASILSNGGNIDIVGESSAGSKTFGFAVEAASGTSTVIGTGAASGHLLINGINSTSGASSTDRDDGALGLVNNGSVDRLTFLAPSVAHMMVQVNSNIKAVAYSYSPPNSGCGTLYPNCGFLTVPGGNNSYLYAGYKAVNMATQALYVTTGSGSKTYDGTATATGIGASSVGGPGGFSISSLGTLVFSTGSKNAGSYTKLIADAANPTSYTSGGTTYAVAYYSNPYSITAKSLTPIAANKTYDGTTAASVSATGLISGDDVTFNYASGSFATADAGNGIAVNVTGLSLSGTDAGNYTLGSSSVTASANITAAPLLITAANASKTYDGTAWSGTPSVSYNGFVNSETASVLSGTLVYGGTAQGAVNAGSYTIAPTGLSSSNYAISYANGGLTIGKAALTISGLTAQNKTYDGTLAATLGGSASLAGIIGSDVVNLSGSVISGSFATASAGTGKTVAADLSSLSLTGAASGNYQIGGLDTALTADIGKASLTVSGLTAQNKTYDGTTSAIIAGTGSLSGVLAADTSSVSLSGSGAGSFATADAASGKTVTANIASFTLAGSAAGNYEIAGVTSPLAADIGKATITVSGLAAQDKTYDGGTAATVTGTAALAGVIGSDAIELSGGVASGNFATASAGTGKGVTADLSSLSLTGASADNYQIGGVTSALTATVNKASLTVSGIVAQNKIYDGSTSAVVSGSGLLTGVLAGDVGSVALSGSGTGSFATADAGNGKTVTASLGSFTLGGSAAGNYQISGLASPLIADIGKATLTVSGLTASGKTYDGTTAATLNGTAALGGVIGSDAVGLTGSVTSGSFVTASAGTGKSVTADLSGLGLTGGAAANYQLGGLGSALTADIGKATLTVLGLAAQNKIYDGSTGATLGGTAALAGVIGSDAVGLTGSVTSGSFASASAGTGKNVTADLSGLSLTGGAAANYQLGGLGSALTADIGKATLTVSGLAAQNKVYDGATAAILGGTATLTGVIGTDVVSLSGSAGSGNFATASAGTSKNVTIDLAGLTLTGAAAANYQIGGLTSAVIADIGRASLTVSGLIAQNKVYDGTTSATISGTGSLSGVLTDDVDLVSLSGSGAGSFATADAGIGKTVSANLGSFTLGGSAAGNYQIAGLTAPLTADITQATLTVSGLTAQNKIYDATTSATLGGTAMLTGVIGSDAVGLSGSATSGIFATASASTGKSVTADLSGLSLAGAAADNYRIGGFGSTLTADIGKADLTVSGLAAQNKIYDGTTGATISGTSSLNGALAGDLGSLSLSGGGVGRFATADAGTGKTVTADIGSFTLSGSAAGNYQISGLTSPLTADIGKATLTISGLTAQDKTYDTTPSAILRGTAALAGVIGSDAVGLAGSATSGSFATASAGSGKSVMADLSSLSLTGAAAANYQLGGLDLALTATIDQAALTISGLNIANKEFDNGTSATIGGTPVLAGVLGADASAVSLSGTATLGSFRDASVGTAKPVAVDLTGLTLGGSAAGNYRIMGLATPLFADITGAVRQVDPQQLLVRPTQVPQFAANNVIAAPPSGIVPEGLVYVPLDTPAADGSDSSQTAASGERANGSDLAIPGGLLGPTTVFVVEGGINITGTATAEKDQ